MGKLSAHTKRRWRLRPLPLDAARALPFLWFLGISSDYLEAVAAHPAIGDKQALRDKFAPSRSGWEATEQSAAAGATEVRSPDCKSFKLLHFVKIQ